MRLFCLMLALSTISLFGGLTIVVPRGTISLNAIVAAAGSNANIILQQGSIVSASSQVVISGSNLVFQCAGGSSITRSSNIDQYVSVTGTNVTFDGCNFDGAGYAGAGLSLSGIGTTVLHGSVTGTGVGIAIFGASSTLIDGVRISGTTDALVFGQDNIKDLRIVNCFLDDTTMTNTAASAIELHTFSSGAYLNNVDVSHNSITHGGSAFAVEAGGFSSGLPANHVSVNNNLITFTANSYGGISFNQCLYCDASHNQMDFGIYTASIMGIETAAQSNYATIAFNHINGAASIDCNAGTYCKIEGNVLVGGGSISAGSSSSTNGGADNSIIRNNAVIGGGLINVNCNFSGCTNNNSVIDNNTVIGAGVGTTVACIQLQAFNGTISNPRITNNTEVGCTYGVQNYTGSNVSAVYSSGNTVGAGVALYSNYPLAPNSVFADLGINYPPSTLAGLGSCVSGVNGASRTATDLMTRLPGSAAVGGGLVTAPVYCDGGVPGWFQ